MGVLKVILLLAGLFIASSDGVTKNWWKHCPWTGWEPTTPYLIRYTAQGYSWFTNMNILYMKMWDPNKWELEEHRCIRMKFDNKALTYKLSYIDKDDKVQLLEGNGEFQYKKEGASLDFHDGFEDVKILNAVNTPYLRLHLKEMSENEIIGFGCHSQKYGWWIFKCRKRYDATYYFATNDDPIEMDQGCIDDKFKELKGVAIGNMKVINMTECESLYSADGGDQLGDSGRGSSAGSIGNGPPTGPSS